DRRPAPRAGRRASPAPLHREGQGARRRGHSPDRRRRRSELPRPGAVRARPPRRRLTMGRGSRRVRWIPRLPLRTVLFLGVGLGVTALGLLAYGTNVLRNLEL